MDPLAQNAVKLCGKEKLMFRSCDACRTSKTRCLPRLATPNDNICQRCARIGKDCVYSEAHGRSKSTNRKPSKTKIHEFEKRIEDIYALLQSKSSVASDFSGENDLSSPNGRQIPANAQPFTLPPITTALDGSINRKHSVNSVMQPMSSTQYPMTPSSSNTNPTAPAEATTRKSPYTRGNDESATTASYDDPLSKGLVTHEESIRLLEIFDNQYASPSLIKPPKNRDIETMQQKNPFLLSAMLLTATRRTDSLETILEKDFRETLALHMLVDGKHSLDLLSGLVMNIMWYVTSPAGVGIQLYTLAQAAVTLVSELNISVSLHRRLYQDNFLEVCRLYATTYYLSASISLAVPRLLSLRFNDTVRLAIRELESANEYPSDRQLVYLIKLQHLAEDIAASFYYDRPNRMNRSLGLEEINDMVQSFEYQLDDLTPGTYDSIASKIPSAEFAWLHCWTYLYEVALQIQIPREGEELGLYNQELHKILLTKLRHKLHAFTDYWLALPVELSLTFINSERSRIAHSTMTLIKLSLCRVGATPTDPFPYRKACKTLHYLDAMSRHALTEASTPYIQQLLFKIKAWFTLIEKSLVRISSDDVDHMTLAKLEDIAHKQSSASTFPPMTRDSARSNTVGAASAPDPLEDLVSGQPGDPLLQMEDIFSTNQDWSFLGAADLEGMFSTAGSIQF